ncbi:putative ABC transport system ATP-binding protein [Nakamurella panacisegetis]|uniref:Putative ABC transport system ATP-binding protein n=1 Tax=Nakamurella panacisegetis TaxID=1090615 RepID=A0A1H0S255_9ACTN|nr:ABC transporter ATP-binding protein [Nakamurella panacisegetis]SDP35328.1 putative ABC transport system ATP-binding protein [Nakamurella panacisegetis]
MARRTKAVAVPESTQPGEAFVAPAPWGTTGNQGLDILEPDPAATDQIPVHPAPGRNRTETTPSAELPSIAADGSVISLHDVTKVYATGSLEVRALDGVSLRIDEGEYVAIMGPSGSGKSTLMHIIGCLDVLSSGSYYLAGEDVSQMDEIDLAEIRNRRIGFVFQQFHLLPSLSAWRNVELPMIYSGAPKGIRRAKAIEALRRVGLESRVNHKPGELSGGQQQRVAVARALVGDPALILADEPTGNLDSTATEDALSLFDELHEQGRTIVLITHELEVAERARRIVRVRDGVIQSDSAHPEIGQELAPAGAHQKGVTA